MKLLCLFLIYFSCLCTGVHPYSREKIVGGENTEIIKVNYQAALEYLGELFCGAAIISKDWLLSTARQCLSLFDDPRTTVKVRTGTSRREAGGNVYNVKNVIYHDDYKKKYNEWYAADIVLIESDTMEMNDLQNFIPLATTGVRPEKNTAVKISGYGKASVFDTRETSPKRLKNATVTVKYGEECDEHSSLSRSVFCATSSPNDKCFGDYGGPAVIYGKLRGLIAGASACAVARIPGIYTNVGFFYTWIKEITGISYDDED